MKFNNILHITDDYLYFKNKKNKEIIKYKLPERTIYGGKISNTKKFIKSFEKLLNANHLNNSLFGDTIKIIVANNYKEADILFLKNIISSFNYRKIVVEKEIKYYKLKENIAYINIFDNYFNVTYLDEYKKIKNIYMETNSFKNTSDILKYIDSGMDLSNFKSILQNNKQDLKKRIQMEKTYIENEYYDFVYQNKPTGCYLMVQFLKGNNLFFYLFMILILVWNVDIWSKDLENNTFRYLFTIGKSRKYVYILRALLHIFITVFFSILFFVVLYLIGYINCGSGIELLIGTTPVIIYLSHHILSVLGWVLFSASCIQCLSLLTKNKGMSLMLTGLLFVFMYTYLHIETLWAYTSLFFIGAICIQFISCLYLERLDLG